MLGKIEYFKKEKLNVKLVRKELEKLSSISIKLDFLNSINEKYKHELINDDTFFSLYGIVQHFISDGAFKTEGYPNADNNPEFTYWFLKYNALKRFNFEINSNQFKLKLKSKYKNELLLADINEIKTEEEEALNLLSKKEIDIHENYKTGRGSLYTFNKNIKYIEALRVLDEDFYTTHCTTHDYNIHGYEVTAYFKHILFKPYLEGLLKKDYLNKENNKLFLKDLFLSKKAEYDKIIALLIDYEFVSKIDNDNTFHWNGNKNETSLKPLKMLGVFGFVLKDKNYLESDINKNQIAEALTNTFSPFELTPQYYGRIVTSVSIRVPNSIEAEYYNSLHFIKCL